MTMHTNNSVPREREPEFLEEKRDETSLTFISPLPPPSRPQAKTSNVLMILPPEIRNTIYKYALACPQMAICISCSKQPALLTAGSLQIRQEAAPIYYSKNKIGMELEIREDKMARTVNKLRTIIDLCGSAPFSGFGFVFTDCDNQNLPALLPLLELIRETGLVLGTKGKIIHDLVNVGKAVEVLEDALALGVQAHEAAWSKEELAETFKIWYKTS